VAELETRCAAFNYIVDFSFPSGSERRLGEFSEVTGLEQEFTVARGHDHDNEQSQERKLAGVHEATEVILKRGIVSSHGLWDWVAEAGRNASAALRTVTITLRDHERKAVATWILRNAIPRKYTGPTLASKGGDDAAIEDLVLSAERIDLKES